MTGRLDAVLHEIDAANLCDPNTDTDDDGATQPEAYLYGLRMTSELDRLFGDAPSDVLRIACRGQHIERWLLKRADYPDGKAGYLKWRRDQGQRHGERLGALMADAGYPKDQCNRVGVLLRKEGIKRDPEVQQLEDVICFTFLTWYFAPFAAKHPDDKVQDIIAKTARKMSNAARERALAEFDLPTQLAEVVAP